MTRRFVPVFVVLGALSALAGCGDHRLTVAGHARFETGDAFEFPTDIRIDAGGTVTGTCQITRSSVDDVIVHGVVVDLYSSGEGGNRSVTVMARDDGSPGSVTARLQVDTYQSLATCDVDVTYVDDGSVTLDSTDCELAATGSTHTAVTRADLHLELHGCDVQ